MTYRDEELLISRPPQSQQKRSRHFPSQSIRIECQAEERHFINSPSFKLNTSLKPIRFTMNDQVKPGRFRSEIIVHNNPNIDFYIKRLRVAFNGHDYVSKNQPSSRSHSLHGPSQGKEKKQDSSKKFRSASLPRSPSQALLHQWIDDICSNEKLMADDDIVFFLKNGEFLARI
jgi:hypothetical protein